MNKKRKSNLPFFAVWAYYTPSTAAAAPKPTVPKTNYGPNREAAYSMPTATYRPQTRNAATDIYTTKDRVGSGYTQSTQPKTQKFSVFDKPDRQNNGNSNMWGVPKTIKDGAVPQKQKSQTVKAGRSTIKIRDDGSTIHYDSDTAIDLFDFLDFLSGRYGPSNEMAESVNRKEKISSIPDMTAKAQPGKIFENPVLQYEDMIRKPDAVYGINADEWIANAPENWENTYKDKWFYGLKGKIYEDKIVSHIDGLKTAEKEILLDNPAKSAYLFFNRDKLIGAKNMATALRDKVYVYNEKESDVAKPYTVEEANVDGSIPNALLHTTWSAFLAYDFGEEFAREITTAHETLDKEQYSGDKIYSQPEIYVDMTNGVYSAEKAYPTLQQHMEMDLHNNALGISIAKEIKQMTDDEVREELEYYYQSGDDAEYFDKMYPELEDDRKRLMFIVCLKAVQYGDAAVIWDKYGTEAVSKTRRKRTI